MKKLLLTSAWITNKSIKRSLLELVWKPFKDLNLAYIPTASNVESWDKSWLINDLSNFKILWFKQIDIVDISAISKNMMLNRLEEADILVFWWWNTFHLMNWIDKSWLVYILDKMLENKVFVWISAWSMIVCKNLDLSTSERLYDENISEESSDKSLWYINFLIRPHLNNKYFPNVNLDNLEKFAKNFPDKFYAIDDQTAIKVVWDDIEVISEWIWKKFN